MKTPDHFYYFSTPQLWAAWQFYRKAPRVNRQARNMALCCLRKLRGMKTVRVIN